MLGQRAPSLFIENPDGLYVDATFGRGGHSRAFLGLLSEKGCLVAFDRDLEAVNAALSLEDTRFRILHRPFSQMREALAEIGIERVDGVFMDIGISSPQIDNPERGFSFSKDGPLDMRMDTTRGITAADFVNNASLEELARVISTYGEERFASAVAKAIVAARHEKPFVTTAELARCVERVVPVNRKDPTQSRAARTFQAIRIQVNDELGELERGLKAAVSLLNPGGQIAVITFHSLEDRLVKRFFAEESHPERALAREIALPQSAYPKARLIDVRRIFPDEAEIAENPRARSAVLRIARKGSDL